MPEQITTENGTAIRNAHGWTWLCNHCHRTYSVGWGPDAVELDLEQLARTIDGLHWCEHTRRTDHDPGSP